MQDNNKPKKPENFSENEEPLPNLEEPSTPSSKPENFSENEEPLPNLEEPSTPSSKPENFSENEESLPNIEEPTAQEMQDSSESSFEEQEGEILPPDKKKKPGSAKVFLLLTLILICSGSYLYLNSLIPAKILNIIFPKSAPSTPPALITQTPLFIEETPKVNESPKSVKASENTISKSATVPPDSPESPETPAIHISGYAPIPKVSGSKFSQTAIKQKQLEASRLLADEPVVEKEVMRAQKFIEKPVTEAISPPKPASQKQEEPLRDKAVLAYLEFIESSLQKLVELTKESFDLSWNYLKGKLNLQKPISNKI
jgi:hypothetical protein